MVGLRKLTNREWESFRDLVHQVAGIALSEQKKVLLVTRLSKRLDALGLATFSEYLTYLTRADPQQRELQNFVNAITTNKTGFYRESHHFELLAQWLRSDGRSIRQARARGLRIWCAAASSGEEPYTIADVVRSAVTQGEWASAAIIATDLDTHVLEIARRGVYPSDSSLGLPPAIRRRMFLRGTSGQRGNYRVRAELREQVKFSQLNLIKSGWLVRGPFDAIFCRNVLIYFDRRTQLDVVTRMCRLLAPHGLLFLGHSEGLAGMDLQLTPIAHSVYRPNGVFGQAPDTQSPLGAADVAERPPAAAPGPRVAGSWTRLALDSGILVLLTADRLTKVRAYRISQGSEDGRESAQVAQLLRDVRHLRSKLQVRAKIVSIRDQAHPEQLSRRLMYVRQQFSQLGVEIVAERTLDESTQIRLEMSTGRLLLPRFRTGPHALRINRNVPDRPSHLAGPP